MKPIKIPECPVCKKSLDSMKEEYSSINTYQFSGDKFILSKEPDTTYNIRCNYCGSIIPEVLVYDILPKLPRV